MGDSNYYEESIQAAPGKIDSRTAALSENFSSLNLSSLLSDNFFSDVAQTEDLVTNIKSSPEEYVDSLIPSFRNISVKVAANKIGHQVVLCLLEKCSTSQKHEISKSILDKTSLIELLEYSHGIRVATKCSENLGVQDLLEVFNNLGVFTSVESVPDHCWIFIEEMVSNLVENEAVKLVISELLQEKNLYQIACHQFGHNVLLSLLRSSENFYPMFLIRWVSSKLTVLLQDEYSVRIAIAVLENLSGLESQSKIYSSASINILMTSIVNKLLEKVKEDNDEVIFDKLIEESSDRVIDAKDRDYLEVPLVIKLSRHVVGHTFVLKIFQNFDSFPAICRKKLLSVFKEHSTRLMLDPIGCLVVKYKDGYM